MPSRFNASEPTLLRPPPTRTGHADGKRRRTARGARCLKALLAALAVAGPGLSSAATVTCYWVGQVYRASLGNGEFDPAFHTWGDAAGWSFQSIGDGGSCAGGTPDNGALQYDVVIADANAPATAAYYGQKSMVQVVKDGQWISPTVSKLTLTNSTLGVQGFTTGTLVADGSRIIEGNFVVNGSGGTSLLNNMTIASTVLRFSGSGAVAQVIGSFALSRYKTASGRSGAVLWGDPPVLSVSSGGTLNFIDATVYGQNATDASLGLIEAAAGSTVGLLGVNSVLGTTLQGEFDARPGSITTFEKTLHQGGLKASDVATINFNRGSMTQLAGAAVPGFSQAGTGTIRILDLTASAGYFSGVIHLAGDGLGGGAVDNTLVGVTVNAGGKLLLDSGSTAFTGLNRGTLSVQRATLQLAGAGTSDAGTIDNLAGGQVLITGSFTNRQGSGVTNSSTLRVENGAILTNLGSVTNLAHGAASNLGLFDSSGRLDNQLGARLSNDGRIVNKGSLVDAGIIDGGGTFTQSSGSSQIDGRLAQASITIGGGALFGTGVLVGATTIERGLVQGGSPGAAGTLTIDGHFVQGQNGTWQTWVGGTGPGHYSVLSVSGDASLDGTLDIVIGNGFSFAAGQSFQIASIHAGTLGGRFARIVDGSMSARGDELAIGDGLTLKVLYASNHVQLEVLAAAVPEPSTWALMLCGVGVVGWLGGRRQARA